MKNPDNSAQMDEEPPINKAIGDLIAIAGGDPEQEGHIIHAILLLCCENLSRTFGRRECRLRLQNLDRFIRDAQPMRPWPD